MGGLEGIFLEGDSTRGHGAWSDHCHPMSPIKHGKNPLGEGLEVHPTVEFNAALRFTLIELADPTSNDLVFFHRLDNIIDLFELEFLADQPVEHEFSSHSHISEHRDILMGSDIAV